MKSCAKWTKFDATLQRAIDFFVAVTVGLFLSPLWLLVAVWVRIKLGSPVLFSQNRIGEGGKTIRIFKFRTMSEARNAGGELLSDEERLGSFGLRMRSWSLDELP